MRKIVLLLLMFSICFLGAQEKQIKSTVIKKSKKKKDPNFEYRFSSDLKQTPDSEKRLNMWFHDAKFGAFIHFGVYSALEGEYKGRGSQHRYSEWVQFSAKMSAEEYHEVASKFNPSEFDAHAWVKVFKDAGMRYVVITSKHHDGFALFKSMASSYNIVDATPFKRDIIKELSEACHEQGLKFGVYYSQAQDWDEPDAPLFNKKSSIRDFHPNLPEDFKPDMDKYIKNKSLPQVKELVKNYEIDLLWFDTPVGMNYERAKLFSDVVRKYRPNCVINSRVIHNGKDKIQAKNLPLFDYVSIGDKEVPTKKLPLYVESPDCVSSSFGYKTKGNIFYHDEKEMIERLVHTVCTGGNYLLNNGPMGNGKLDPEAVRLYGKIGKWMKKNSESIHDTKPNPFNYRPEWGDVSISKDGTILYLHILHVPESDEIYLTNFSNKILSAKYLVDNKTIKFKQKGGDVSFKLLKKSEETLDLVVKVVLKKSLF